MKPHQSALIPGCAHFLLAFSIVCVSAWALAQAAPQEAKDEWKPGTTVTELKDVVSGANPTRVVQTRSEVNGRRIETRVTEAASINGGYAPISETEQETVQVDANTTRVVHRVYGRDASGSRRLVRVTEEEKTKLPGGAERVVRTSSDADTNGRLQMTGREIQQTTPIGSDSKRTETTILSVTPNGFAPVQKTMEVEQRRGDTTEIRKSSLGVDVNGRLVPFEERQTSTTTTDATRTTQDRVVADSGNGMTVVQVTKGTEVKDAQGQQRSEVQTFTPYVPGAAPGTDLYLGRQVTTVTRTLPSGGQETEQQVKVAIPTAPREGLRVEQAVTEVSRPTAPGKTETKTRIKQWDGNQGLQTVMIGDTYHSTVVH
ncbi:MAG: hypothetical protein ACE14M_04510 [Terriglobales bacterium]